MLVLRGNGREHLGTENAHLVLRFSLPAGFLGGQARRKRVIGVMVSMNVVLE